MERNEDTLSTRDLASPNEPVRGTAAAEGDVRDGVLLEDGQHGVHDQPHEEEPRLPIDEERIAPSAGEQTRLPAAEHTPPPPEFRAGASAREQTLEAGGPENGLGIKSGAPGHEPPDSPADSTQAGSLRDQDVDAAPASTSAAVSASDASGSLLSADLDATFQQRWKEIQTRFVDEPRGAVEDADGLVANLMQQLAEGFAKERERLEAQWGRGEDISTEDLRVALQRYRTFFQRLLST
jgi:hypothetical protein